MSDDKFLKVLFDHNVTYLEYSSLEKLHDDAQEVVFFEDCDFTNCSLEDLKQIVIASEKYGELEDAHKIEDIVLRLLVERLLVSYRISEDKNVIKDILKVFDNTNHARWYS
jgi:hypothetical protein